MKMKLKSLLLLPLLLLVAIPCVQAESQYEVVSSYYPYIQELHNGKIIWHKDSSNPYDLGVMYRAVVFKQEAYYGVFIETLKISDEGGAELMHTKLVEMDMPSRFKFLGWSSPNTFKAIISSDTYEISISDNGKTINKNKTK